MTKQEFMRQIWRPYDTVELEGGAIGKVTTVCFPTRSVKVTLSDNVHEWIECEFIVSHTSVVGNPDDLAIIEDLHEKLMKAEKKIENMQTITKSSLAESQSLKAKLNNAPPKEIKKQVNILINALTEKRATLDAIDSAVERINFLMDRAENTEE